jgi:hypothetical protein
MNGVRIRNKSQRKFVTRFHVQCRIIALVDYDIAEAVSVLVAKVTSRLRYYITHASCNKVMTIS